MSNDAYAERMNEELWRPVVGYEGAYEVSDQGRVRSIARVVSHAKTVTRTLPDRILSQRITRSPYPIIQLCGADHKKHVYKVHLLMLEAFAGPRPTGYVACHANDEPTDNRLENLRWDTLSANMYDKVKNGRHHNARKTHCKQGHEYTFENTYVGSDRRNCRACQRERQQKYMADRP